jgi:hypothetical protein
MQSKKIVILLVEVLAEEGVDMPTDGYIAAEVQEIMMGCNPPAEAAHQYGMVELHAPSTSIGTRA